MFKKTLNHRKVILRSIYNATTPELDTDYICNKKNSEEISDNIKQRKGIGDINLIHELNSKLSQEQINISVKTEKSECLQQQLLSAMLKLPNRTHPSIKSEEPRLVKTVGKPRHFNFKPRDFHEITKRMHLARTEHLGVLAGSRSYFLYGDLAALEQALIKFSLRSLLQKGFQLISVPDILDRGIIEGCGMSTHGERTQVYSLDHEQNGDLCMSGTSEMALAGYFSNKTLTIDKLPMKVAAVSRCFRAESSSIAEERGIFRVHQFTKVEMFALTTPEHSEDMLEEFRTIEEDNFESLGLHYKTLDMPAHELGAPAFRKYDIEAWMPGRNMFGEISSCSNCTDYQSRRLGIKFKQGNDGELRHVHTVNGTACAGPRMLIALVENFQNDNGTIDVPKVLQEYFGKAVIKRQKGVPELKLIKSKK